MNMVNFRKYEKISNLQISDIFKIDFLKKPPFYFLIILYKSIYSLWSIRSYKIGVGGLFYI